MSLHHSLRQAILDGTSRSSKPLVSTMKLFQILGYIVAVLSVVGHDEQNGFLAKFLVLTVGLAPFLHAQGDIVGVFLGVSRALPFREFGSAGGIGKHRMFDHIWGDGFNQRVITDSLNEDCSVIVLRCGSHIDL